MSREWVLGRTWFTGAGSHPLVECVWYRSLDYERHIVTLDDDEYVVRRFNDSDSPLNPVIAGPFESLEAAKAAVELID